MRTWPAGGLPDDFQRGEGGVHEEQGSFILSFIRNVSGVTLHLYGITWTYSGRSVLDLDESMLGDYMELCQRGLLRPEMLRSGRNGETGPNADDPKWADQRTLEDFFPLEPGRVCASGGKTGIERQEGDQRAMRAGISAEGGRTDRKEREPGEGYAIYRSRDELGELPEEVGSVIWLGARWVGVDEEKILKVSEGYERRLWNWWVRGRRGPSLE